MLTIQSLSYELCGYSTYNVKYTDEHGHLGVHYLCNGYYNREVDFVYISLLTILLWERHC